LWGGLMVDKNGHCILRALVSRKFLLTAYAITLMFVIALLSVKYVVLKEVLDSFGALGLAALGLYFGGNVGNKYVLTKNGQGTKENEHE
jgi:hypothetical protein